MFGRKGQESYYFADIRPGIGQEFSSGFNGVTQKNRIIFEGHAMEDGRRSNMGSPVDGLQSANRTP